MGKERRKKEKRKGAGTIEPREEKGNHPEHGAQREGEYVLGNADRRGSAIARILRSQRRYVLRNFEASARVLLTASQKAK